MKTLRQIISDFAQRAGIDPVSFTGFDVKKVTSIQVCDEAGRYFAASVPAATIDVGKFRILSPDDLLIENKELIPGHHTAPYGFLTFIAMDTGDAVSMDVQTGAVHVIGVDKFEEGQIALGWKPDYSDFFDPIPITRDNILLASECCWPSIAEALSSLWHSLEDGK